MFGKPEWFKRRKYGGWGLYPATWQAWVYIVVFMLPVIVFQSLPFWRVETRIAFTIVWLSILFFDTIHIMIHLKRDEREYKIEAMAERNAAWAMLVVLISGLLYQSFKSALVENFSVDPFLIGSVVAGTIAKLISNLVYERKQL